MGRADWMAGRWGVMVHWIAPGPPPERGPYRSDLNDAVDHFDVSRFLEDFATTGADWLIFTVGQNTGYYVSPNRLLDEWAGPGHCSDRDLISEIMDGVTGQYTPVQQTPEFEVFVAKRLEQVSCNLLLTVPGFRVKSLFVLRHQLGIENALQLKQRGIPKELEPGQAELAERWLRECVEEAEDQMPRKRFIAYLPCEVAATTSVHDAFCWNIQEGTAQGLFQERYTAFIREWAMRWGRRCSGWWFDGCYTWPIFHNTKMVWRLWFDAARAGNTQAAVAFNDGSFCVGSTRPVTNRQDFLSGEVEILEDGAIRLGRSVWPTYHMPKAQKIGDSECQRHALVPIDCVWAHGTPPTGLFEKRFARVPKEPIFPMEKPVYTDDELARFLDSCLSVGCGVTFNVGIYQEGHFGRETVAQLKRVGQRLKR